MKRELIELIEIFKPNGRDWLDYVMTRDNPYTFHHIKEKRNGGKLEVRNGAIITNDAHIYLNHLDYNYHRIYQELNYMFKCLNRTMKPPTEEYYEEIHHILKKVR